MVVLGRGEGTDTVSGRLRVIGASGSSIVDLDGLEAMLLAVEDGLSHGDVCCLLRDAGLRDDDDEAVRRPGEEVLCVSVGTESLDASGYARWRLWR